LAGNSSDSGRSVTSKVVAILLTFTDGAMHSLTEIARLTALPTSTVHRLVSELAAWGVLERTEDAQYRVGVPLRTVCATTPGFTPNMREWARRTMEDVSDATRSDVRFGMLHGSNVQYIEKAAGHMPVTTFPPTRVLPAHASAMGKAILAFSQPRIVESMIARGLTPCTANTIISAERLRKTLSRIRLTRVAISRGELRNGVCVVAVPVFSGGGNVVAALEVDVRDLATDLRVVHPVLTVAARSLSRELLINHTPNRSASSLSDRLRPAYHIAPPASSLAPPAHRGARTQSSGPIDTQSDELTPTS
jgi:DNA-binding IclR family transcriptional regulator